MRDPNRPLITPSITTKLRPPVTEQALLVPLRRHLQGFLAQGGRDRGRSSAFGESRYYPPVTKGGVGLIGPFFGAAFAAVVADEAIAAGAKQLLFFGLAGGVSEKAEIGDLLLVDSAFADEAAGPAYLPGEDEFTGDADLLARLGDHFKKHDVPCKHGRVWTTDALFQETPARIAVHQEAGRDLVEMEISPIYAVAKARGVPAAAIVVVSDHVGGERWRTGFFRPSYRLALTRAIRVLNLWEGP